MTACFLAELVLTFFFLMVIIGTTSKGAATGFAGISDRIGADAHSPHSIPIIDTSVNPARSIGPALFAGGAAIAQLWLFIVAPIAGAIAAGALARCFTKTRPSWT